MQPCKIFVMNLSFSVQLGFLVAALPQACYNGSLVLGQLVFPFIFLVFLFSVQFDGLKGFTEQQPPGKAVAIKGCFSFQRSLASSLKNCWSHHSRGR